jgi:hypothetical protein
MKKVLALMVCMAVCGAALFAQTTEDEWYEKADEYWARDDYANAVTAYNEVIKRNSSNINAYWERGFSYYMTKNYDAAIADYSTFIKGKNGAPGFPYIDDIYVLRGDAYGAKGIYHMAVADYRTGFEKGHDTSTFVVDKSSKADMWFCGTMYMEIVINRFLGKSDMVTKYETGLKTVCDNNGVTRAEVEAFYRQNIGSLIVAVVDAEFNRVAFTMGSPTGGYNAVLTRNANNQYILSYEDANDVVKELPPVSLEALLVEMSKKTAEFNQNSVNAVRAQAALIPAVVLDDWKRYTPNMADPRTLLADALTNFYVTPSQRNYEIIRGIYARPRLAYAVDNDDFTSKLGLAVVGSVSDELAAKISKEISRNDALLAAVEIPDDPRFGVFTLSLKAGQDIFVKKTNPAAARQFTESH